MPKIYHVTGGVLSPPVLEPSRAAACTNSYYPQAKGIFFFTAERFKKLGHPPYSHEQLETIANELLCGHKTFLNPIFYVYETKYTHPDWMIDLERMDEVGGPLGSVSSRDLEAELLANKTAWNKAINNSSLTAVKYTGSAPLSVKKIP